MRDIRPLIIHDLNEKTVKASKNVKKTLLSRKTSPKAIAIFDLSNSSRLKISRGHYEGTEKALLHNDICKLIIKDLRGTVIKELGDGVLASFDKPLDSIKAALNIKTALKRKKIVGKSALTFGDVEVIRRTNDIIGNVVDRCAYIEKLARPNQILIDRALRDTVATFLTSYNIKISLPFSVELKTDGRTEIFEITFPPSRLQNSLVDKFIPHETGRLAVSEKVTFMKKAKCEIIEIGMGIREFTRYFMGRNPHEFKEPVKEILKTGVKFNCLAIDPFWILKTIKFSKKERDYFKQIPQTINQLKTIRDQFKSQGLNFEIRTYHEIPHFHALCIDGNTKKGSILISNYLPGIERSACPVLEFSKISNPIMFDVYWKSIQRIIKSSKIIK